MRYTFEYDYKQQNEQGTSSAKFKDHMCLFNSSVDRKSVV